MKYLSIDIESTGLDEDCLMIEVAIVPFDTSSKSIARDLAFHQLIQCPPFEILRPKLNPWVVEHNQRLIESAHNKGLPLNHVKDLLTRYLSSKDLKHYFNTPKYVVFGKSLNAIDLPFFLRDFGWEFMHKFFSHKVCDLTSVAYALIDLGLIPVGSDSSSELMKYFQMGNVAHTALEDAVNTATLYLKLLDKCAAAYHP